MAKWTAYATVTGGKYIGTIEAETEDEAIERAYELDACYVSMCHVCSKECEDAQVAEVSVIRLSDSEAADE